MMKVAEGRRRSQASLPLFRAKRSETSIQLSSFELEEQGSSPESTFAIELSSVLNEILVEIRVDLNEGDVARKHRKFEV